METYIESLHSQAGESLQSSDLIDTVRRSNFQEHSSPTHLRGGGHINTTHQQTAPTHPEEAKAEVRHKGALLMQEVSCNTYEQYLSQQS